MRDTSETSSPLPPDLDGIAQLPSFPVQCLPAAWTTWVGDTAARRNVAVDHVGLGLFAAVAGVAGAGMVAQPIDGWREPLVLWQCAVGRAGSGKSAGLAAGRRLIASLDGGWRDDDDEAEAPQRIVGEGTLRSLAAVVSRNPNGVVMWRGELLGWLPGRGRACAGWKEAWSAEPMVVNRGAAAARLELEHFPVSVVGGMTPDDLARALKGADSALASCFLYAWPAPAPWQSLLLRPGVDDDAAQFRLRRIAEATGTAHEPTVMRMDDDALRAFDAFCAKWRPIGLEEVGPMAGWLMRGPAQVARLAAVLRLLEWSEGQGAGEPMIGQLQVEHAIILWRDYFRPHAEAVMRLGVRGRDDTALRRALRWLRSTTAATVSREDIRVHALSRTVDARGADTVIGELEEMGVLARDLTGSGGRGRPALRWVVCGPVSGNSVNGEKAPSHRHPSHLGTDSSGNSPGQEVWPIEEVLEAIKNSKYGPRNGSSGAQPESISGPSAEGEEAPSHGHPSHLGTEYSGKSTKRRGGRAAA